MKLALDAGHYKYTPGRRCSKEFDPEEHREWFLNQRICNYIEQYAKEYEDFEILRVDDRLGELDPDLLVRADQANKWGADLFYSAHHNGGIHGGSGGGVTAYAHANNTNSSSWRDGLYDAIIQATGLKGNRSSPRAVASYTVLTATNMPAVLIEHGFMDSSTDVPIIISEDFPRKVGKAVADYIANRVGLHHKSEPAAPVPDSPTSTQMYTIKDGDTLDGIASKFNVSAEDIAALNLIIPGKVIYIPAADSVADETIVPLALGDEVTLTDDAVWWNGNAIPSWVKGRTLYVREISSFPKIAVSTIKDPAGAITGRIDEKYVRRVL